MTKEEMEWRAKEQTAMTKDQLAARYKTPVEMMLDGLEWKALPAQSPDPDGLPVVTHEGLLRIGEVTMKCYQLSDGQRVIDADSAKEFFESGFRALWQAR